MKQEGLPATVAGLFSASVHCCQTLQRSPKPATSSELGPRALRSPGALLGNGAEHTVASTMQELTGSPKNKS